MKGSSANSCNTYRQCLTRTSLCNAHQVSPTQGHWPAISLNGGRLFPALLLNHFHTVVWVVMQSSLQFQQCHQNSPYFRCFLKLIILGLIYYFPYFRGRYLVMFVHNHWRVMLLVAERIKVKYNNLGSWPLRSWR